MTDVVNAAWTAAGKPILIEPTVRARCARCGTATDTVPVASVVSRNFTGYDGWLVPSGRGLCGACVWAYRTPGLRQHQHLVRRSPPMLRCLDPAGSRHVLARGNPPPAEALIVPLRAGRKHLLAAARWGTVHVDDTALPWGSEDAARLEVFARLRSLGFSTLQLAEPAPPYQAMRRIRRRAWPTILADWADLEAWRSHSLWLALAAAVTNTPVEGCPRGGHSTCATLSGAAA